MKARKQRDVWQYGDFQTPGDLAFEVCKAIAQLAIRPRAVLEPTCGRGAFLSAAGKCFPGLHILRGVEINPQYAAEARAIPNAQVEQGDFFATDWPRVLSSHDGPWLILGNPPWVTNSELGSLGSANVPSKSNFQGHKGLDAITGKANFDISEWMLLQQIDWLSERSGWIAMLVKTSVARKVLRQAWKAGKPVGRSSIFPIDAMRSFGAAVDACLFVLPVNMGAASQDCDVYASLTARSPEGVIGFHDGMLIADVQTYAAHRDLLGANKSYVWRSGVKHDCSGVMELSKGPDGKLANGEQTRLDLEDSYLFPMLKSSDVAKGRERSERFMLVTQREIGADTSTIRTHAPKTWSYLHANAGRLDRRGSVIYKNKPRFSVFGVGRYTFAPWKVAISGFYDQLRFLKVGPVGNKPVVFDDTIYFLPCECEEEADFVSGLVQSSPYQALLRAMMFPGEKRPITADLLKRISLERVARDLGLDHEYRRFAKSGESQMHLSLV